MAMMHCARTQTRRRTRTDLHISFRFAPAAAPCGGGGCTSTYLLSKCNYTAITSTITSTIVIPTVTASASVCVPLCARLAVATFNFRSVKSIPNIDIEGYPTPLAPAVRTKWLENRLCYTIQSKYFLNTTLLYSTPKNRVDTHVPGQVNMLLFFSFKQATLALFVCAFPPTILAGWLHDPRPAPPAPARYNLSLQTDFCNPAPHPGYLCGVCKKFSILRSPRTSAEHPGARR